MGLKYVTMIYFFVDSLVLIAFFGKTAKKLKDSDNRDTTISDAHFVRVLDNVFHSLVLLIGEI